MKLHIWSALTRAEDNVVAKVRALQSISYVVAVKRVEGMKGTLEDSMVLEDGHYCGCGRGVPGTKRFLKEGIVIIAIALIY